MSNTTTSGHLAADDFYDFIQERLPRRRRAEVTTHLENCADCAETLAMIVRAERPASPEEEALLARIPEPSFNEVLAGLHSAIAATAPGSRPRKTDWKTLLVAATLFLGLATASWYVYTKIWLPEESRRIAAETMAAVVEIRQGTGRIPLRYITELERASVTRSGFDDVDPTAEALLENLRTAVERAPVPEAELALGLLELDDGELDEAESLFRTVLEHDPRSVDALNGLAVIDYVRAQQDPENSYRLLQQGLKTLRDAQAAAPEDLRVLYNFGKYYAALDMTPAAIQAWTRYLQKDRASQWGEEVAFHLSQIAPR
jgi:tetratricopeptide (TPR) repeat protein